MTPEVTSQYNDPNSRYSDFHYKDKKVIKPSYICINNGDSYTGSTVCVYWDCPQISPSRVIFGVSCVECLRNDRYLLDIMLYVIPGYIGSPHIHNTHIHGPGFVSTSHDDLGAHEGQLLGSLIPDSWGRAIEARWVTYRAKHTVIILWK